MLLETLRIRISRWFLANLRVKKSADLLMCRRESILAVGSKLMTAGLSSNAKKIGINFMEVFY